MMSKPLLFMQGFAGKKITEPWANWTRAPRDLLSVALLYRYRNNDSIALDPKWKKSIAVILHLGMVQLYRTRIRKSERFCFFLLQIPKVRAKTCVEKIVLCSCKNYVRSIK